MEELIEAELKHCPSNEVSYFHGVKITPTKWSQSPWGDEGGGFWVVAVDGNHVLWYNDIEHGFNVSAYEKHGVIPEDAYFCNQDEISSALERLASHRPGGFGSPVST
ncbi:MAG: hypothetical protein AAGF72_00860 [Pseudomonadota bacterium]